MTPNQWQALQRSLATATVRQLNRRWRELEQSPDFGSAWDGVYAAQVVATAQLDAARPAPEYVSDQIGRPAAPQSPLRPEALSGVASDGRPLATLMRLPAASTIRALNRGTPPRQAFALGRRRMGMLAATQVFDAARAATSVVQAADPGIVGYVRHLRGNTNCPRCIVLAGRFYGWSDGFARHPRCDCFHKPTTSRRDADDFSPERYFEGLSKAQQDATFGPDAAQAIRDGADLGQVVNARRGMKTTTAYGRKVAANDPGLTPLRVMPEQILEDASDRAEAVRLLGVHGFI